MEKFYLKSSFVLILTSSTDGWLNGSTPKRFDNKIVSKTKKVKIFPNSFSSFLSNVISLKGIFFNLKIALVALDWALIIDSKLFLFKNLISSEITLFLTLIFFIFFFELKKVKNLYLGACK